MSPLQIEILLWYHARACDFREGDFSAPAVRAAIDDFKGDAGLLIGNTIRDVGGHRTYVLSERGRALVGMILGAGQPIPLRLNCPICGALHIDEGEFATKPHHTHSCQSCGMTWRPAVVATVGVQFLPGFKNK